MKLAILGADSDALALARWAVERGGQQLVAAYECGPLAAEVRRLAPQARLNEDWEALVLGSAADAVIVGRGGDGQRDGISASERRADQLRKLAQAAVPMIVVCPACESIVGYEIEMIAKDTQCVIAPYVPGADRPELARLAEIVPGENDSPIGRVEQIVLEREQVDRSRDAVLVQLARDVALVRRLIGAVQTVSAQGDPPPLGRDPLGPKSKVLPSLANLSVTFSGEHGRTARWAVIPALTSNTGRLTLIGQHGKVVLNMPAGAPWSVQLPGDSPPPVDHEGSEAGHIFRRLARALEAHEYVSDSAWLAACRDQEAAEAVDRSLERGRTIELFNVEHTEAASFKGVMAMGGCLLLLVALFVLFMVVVVEGLHIPIRGWRVWQLWPAFLLAPLALFLVLQLLQFVIQHDAAHPRRIDERRIAT